MPGRVDGKPTARRQPRQIDGLRWLRCPVAHGVAELLVTFARVRGRAHKHGGAR
jgi:hypothetical protein